MRIFLLVVGKQNFIIVDRDFVLRQRFQILGISGHYRSRYNLFPQCEIVVFVCGRNEYGVSRFFICNFMFSFTWYILMQDQAVLLLT